MKLIFFLLLNPICRVKSPLTLDQICAVVNQCARLNVIVISQFLENLSAMCSEARNKIVAQLQTQQKELETLCR